MIKCVVACTNANGEPDFYFCKVEATQEEYDDGIHYERAKGKAKEEGYEAPFVVFDENDGLDWLFEHFVWESV